MKKRIFIIFATILFLIVGFAPSVFAQDEELNGFDAVFDGIFNSREDLIDGLEFLSIYINDVAQVSQFTMLNADAFSLGINGNVAFVDTKRIREIGGSALSDAMDKIPLIGAAEDFGVLPMGNIYLSYNIPKIPVSAYARGLWIPLATAANNSGSESYFDDFILVGAGVAFNAEELFPEKLNEETGEMEESMFILKAVANYHFSSGIPFLNFHSVGAEVMFGLQLVNHVINPYVSVGWDTTVIDLNVDLWGVYDAWFNASGEELPTRQDIQDYFDHPNVPDYAQDRLKQKIEEKYGGSVSTDTSGNYVVDDWGSATDDDAQDILTVEDRLSYPANFPFSLGVHFKLAMFNLGVEYSTHLFKLFNLRSGSLSITAGFSF